jgi:DnaJ-domain-containing protein 1
VQIGWPELILIAIVLVVFFTTASRPLGRILRSFLDGLSGKLDRYETGNSQGNKRSGNTAQKTARSGDPYKILNISPGATQEQIRSAYKKLAHMYHPDKVEGLAPEYRQIADRKMKAINAAYEQLKLTRSMNREEEK